MSSFRVRSFTNGDVRWIDLEGDATATGAERLQRDLAAAFDTLVDDEAPPGRYVLDLSAIGAEEGGETLDAILDAIPADTRLALIPPQTDNWIEAVGRRHALVADVFSTQGSALQALGIRSRGQQRESPEDGRRHARVDTALRAKIWFEHPTGTRWGQAYISNLSRSGALLKRIDVDHYDPDMYRWLASGVPAVSIDLAVGGGRGRIKGRVVRLKDTNGLPNLGVQFEEVPPQLAVALAAFIEENRAESVA